MVSMQLPWQTEHTLTGGMDCMLKLWSRKRGARPRCVCSVRAGNPHPQAQQAQVVNPPFVYAAAASPEPGARRFAVALGDGSVALYDTGEQQTPELRVQALYTGHDGAATCL